MTDGLCLKFVFDTYEQEVERYGGLDGMVTAGTLFSIDSRYAASCYAAQEGSNGCMTVRPCW